MMGKVAWLANRTLQDFCFMAHQMSKKNKEATISSLKYVKRVLKKVIEPESKLK